MWGLLLSFATIAFSMITKKDAGDQNGGTLPSGLSSLSLESGLSSLESGLSLFRGSGGRHLSADNRHFLSGAGRSSLAESSD
jgi:hypothetical protein